MAFFPSMPDADMKDTLAREPAIGIPFSQLNEAIMRGDAPFTAGERELLAAYVSALNGCDYCQCEHAALAAAFGFPAGLLAQLLQDVDTAEVSETFRAAVVYARKLTLCPTRLGPADVEALFAAGHDERALYFLVFVTAVFTMSNRIVQGLGLTTPSPALCSTSWRMPNTQAPRVTGGHSCLGGTLGMLLPHEGCATQRGRLKHSAQNRNSVAMQRLH